MRSRPPVPSLGRRLLVFVVVALALAVLIAAYTGDRGYLEARRRQAAYAELSAEADRLRADNAALLEQIDALKRDPYAVEKIARERLGYALPGEVIYLFPPEEGEAR